MRSTLQGALLALVVATSLSAQIQTLTTTFAGGNGQSGNMFEVSAAAPILIQSFDINANPGTYNAEVYALPAGTPYFPNVNNAAAWGAPIATVTGLVVTAAGVPSPLNLALNFPVTPGVNQAFYVTLVTSTNIIYTNGTAVGNVAATDGILTIFEGSGVQHPFIGNFSPRVWNGVISYTLASAGPSPYQTNSPEASLDLDGRQTNGFTPAKVTNCPGAISTLTIASTLVGNGFDTAVAVGTLIPSGITTPGGQVVNVNLASPFLFFLNGGAAPNLAAPFPGSIVAPVAAPAAPFNVHAQMVIINPAHPDLFSLSQGSELESTASSGSITGPTGDDTSTVVSLRSTQLCGASDMLVYGTLYSQIQVISNGRVMFGTANVGFTPTIAQAAIDSPSIGAWADFNPGGAPAIQISTNAANEVVVSFGTATTPLPYFGSTVTNQFNVRMDASTGTFTIGNLAGISAGTGQMWLGISGGNQVGATTPAASAFSSGASGSTTNATDMIYAFGTAGSLTPGVSEILFFPNTNSNYDWLAL